MDANKNVRATAKAAKLSLRITDPQSPGAIVPEPECQHNKNRSLRFCEMEPMNGDAFGPVSSEGIRYERAQTKWDLNPMVQLFQGNPIIEIFQIVIAICSIWIIASEVMRRAGQ